MNPTTGLLAPLKNVQTGANPADIKVHPNGRFAYVTERQGGASSSTTFHTLWRYAIDLMGGMTHVQTLKTGGASPVSVALHPTGQFIYVADLYADEELQADGVSIISVDPISGALTRRATVAAGSLPTAVAVDPTGRFAYVANRSYRQMSMYSISANGMLTPIRVVGTGNSAVSLAVDPTGRFAYMANSGDDTLSAYKLAADGKLIPLGNTATGHDPQSVTADSTGQFAYAANQSSGSLSKYRIDVTTGRITPLGTVATRSGPAAVITFTPPALG